jgi:hypothetical protein
VAQSLVVICQASPNLSVHPESRTIFFILSSIVRIAKRLPFLDTKRAFVLLLLQKTITNRQPFNKYLHHLIGKVKDTELIALSNYHQIAAQVTITIGAE